jgi:diadenosine tetraphosphatase ApaH/serine/threonine PP2A family protein phosphatase
MCFGHTHKPYHRIFETESDNTKQYKHAINIGSVGKPKDGNPKGCYVMLHIDSTSSVVDKNTVQVEFIRFEYDVEKAAKAIEDSILPNEFADMLRNGK